MLDHDQEKAIKSHSGPLIVIAGAGTGKTTVIVEKIKYLIKKGLAKPEEILALTFTEKAAFEMEERVDKMLPFGYFQMWISTFHAFAEQILKEEIQQNWS
jgi:DNA helicase-2/ATP-dependent DNA helicase PcrA